MHEHCPTCGETTVVEYDTDTVQCASCRTPLRKSWIDTEHVRIVDDWSDV